MTREVSNDFEIVGKEHFGLDGLGTDNKCAYRICSNRSAVLVYFVDSVRGACN